MAGADEKIAAFWSYVTEHIAELRVHDIMQDAPTLVANRGKDLMDYYLQLTPSGVMAAKMYRMLEDIGPTGTFTLDFSLRQRRFDNLPEALRQGVEGMVPRGMLILKEMVIDCTTTAHEELVDKITAAGNAAIEANYDKYEGWRVIKHKIANSTHKLELKVGSNEIPADRLMCWIDHHGQGRAVLIFIGVSINLTDAELIELRKQAGVIIIECIGHYLAQKHGVVVQVLRQPPIGPDIMKRLIPAVEMTDALTALVAANYRQCSLCGVFEYNSKIANVQSRPAGHLVCENCMTLYRATARRYNL